MSHQKNNRVAIITYARAYNYGSALQGYALNRYVRSQGFDVKTIDYSNEAQVQMYKIFEPYAGVRSIARNFHSLLNFRKLKRHISNFENFLANYVPMTEPIRNAENLTPLNSAFDYFICGSDQIWNVQCGDFDSSYMLSFVSDKNKCIAYAPSLGNAADNPAAAESIRRYASDFRALSSREAGSTPVIAEATHREVTAVCDPVFLLSADEWSEIATPRRIQGDYILGYFIGDIAGMRDFADKLRKCSKRPVVVVYKNLRDLKYNFKNAYESGPAEFVSLIKHSSGIVTNSFHAISFALIFQKQFWGFIPTSSDSRISGLLNLVNLKSRLLTKDNSADIYSTDGIDFAKVNFAELDKLISTSKIFIKESCPI